MGINTRPPRRKEDKPRYTDQYKPTHAKISRWISTSEISPDKPHMVPTDAIKRDLALSLISPHVDSRRKTTRCRLRDGFQAAKSTMVR